MHCGLSMMQSGEHFSVPPSFDFIKDRASCDPVGSCTRLRAPRDAILAPEKGETRLVTMLKMRFAQRERLDALTTSRQSKARRSDRLSAVGFVCIVFAAACATAERPGPLVEDSLGGEPGASGGAAPGSGGDDGTSDGSGGSSSGSGGDSSAAGGKSHGSGGSSSGGSSSGGSSSGGSSSGSGGAGCFLGICPAATGGAGGGAGCFLGICPASTGGAGGAMSTPDGGDAHKAMCNQKLCVDPIFDCILQGCGDAVCQIPFCVIK